MTDYTGTDNLEAMAEARNYNRFLHELVLAHAWPGDNILDFGAGIGTFAREIALSGYSVLYVKPDAGQAETIRSTGLEVTTELDSIADGSIDYIYTLNVLEHIEDDASIARQLYSKLKSDGKLLIYVSALQLLFSSINEKAGHYRRYSMSSLRQLVTQAGFSIETVRYADSAGFFATLAYKLVGSRSGDINTRSLVFYDRLIFPLSRLVDRLTGRLSGKNMFVVASKHGNQS